MKKYIISYIINFTTLVLNVEVDAINHFTAISSIMDESDEDNIIILSCINLRL